MKKMINQEKGITLIALVITIVILIILAIVTITLVFGEGGLIQRAQESKKLTDQAQKDEQDELKGAEELINGVLTGTDSPETSTDPTEQTPTPIEEITKGEIFEETTKLEDATDDTFYVPGGFGIDEESPDEIDEGIVISNADDTKQFVWIPVNDYTTMYQEAPGTKLTGVETTTDVYSKLRIREADQEDFTAGKPGDSLLRIVREPDLLSDFDTNEEYYKDILGYNSPTEMAEAFVEEYEATYNSIKKYKGFYIGRYELTGSVESPTVQKNQTVLTNQNWYNLKKACTNVVSSEYAQSTMVYGNQWDEIMSWLVATGDKTEYQVNENSTDWGNYYNLASIDSGKLQTSGKNEAWKANNIYDLAGNCYECTRSSTVLTVVLIVAVLTVTRDTVFQYRAVVFMTHTFIMLPFLAAQLYI